MGLIMLQALAGAALWAVANVVYFDMKRKGLRGFRRLVAFWFGTPTTWLSFFLVPEGHTDLVKPPPDDVGALLAEVRQDRARRIAAEAEERHRSDGSPGPDPEDEESPVATASHENDDQTDTTEEEGR